MATINCSELLEDISIGEKSTYLPAVIFDESSLSYSSRSLSGRGLVEINNEQYWASFICYGKFSFSSISSYEKSKVTSFYLTIDGLGGYSERDLSLKLRDFLNDPYDFEDLLLSKEDYITGSNYDDFIDSKGGNDEVIGGNGDDYLKGGSGKDKL